MAGPSHQSPGQAAKSALDAALVAEFRAHSTEEDHREATVEDINCWFHDKWLFCGGHEFTEKHVIDEFNKCVAAASSKNKKRNKKNNTLAVEDLDKFLEMVSEHYAKDLHISQGLSLKSLRCTLSGKPIDAKLARERQREQDLVDAGADIKFYKYASARNHQELKRDDMVHWCQETGLFHAIKDLKCTTITRAFDEFLMQKGKVSIDEHTLAFEEFPEFLTKLSRECTKDPAKARVIEQELIRTLAGKSAGPSDHRDHDNDDDGGVPDLEGRFRMFTGIGQDELATCNDIKKWFKAANLMADGPTKSKDPSKKCIESGKLDVEFSKIQNPCRKIKCADMDRLIPLLTKCYADKNGITEAKASHEIYTELSKACKPQAPRCSLTGNVEKLCDTKEFTGVHRQRFDEDGRGKGLEGSRNITPKDGYVAGYKNKDTYHETH